jgi:hypothetical protein
MVRSAAVPGQQQIRLQHREPLLVNEECIADPRQCGRGFRIVGVGAYSDQRFAGAGSIGQFGQVR